MDGKAVNRATGKRGSRTVGKRNDYKKAYVVVAEGQTIPVFAAQEEEVKK
jgi:ribosomal protein L23